MTEDKLREETKRLMCDKESYQTAAKENLKRLVDEKLEASKRLKEVCMSAWPILSLNCSQSPGGDELEQP